MTEIFNSSRKRSRSSEEEDFLPLSKKINNLHINKWNNLGETSQVENEVMDPWAPKYQPNLQTSTAQAWPPPYAPQLSPQENPFYYDNNKLLYELYLARSHRDGKPMLRQGDTGDWVGTFQGHKGAVWGVALNPAATHAATGAADFQAKVWDAISGEVLHSFQHQHIVKSVAFSSDSALLVTGSNERLVRLFDLNRPEADPVVFSGHTAGVKSVGFLRGQSHVVSCADDRTIRVWDRSTGAEVQKVELASIPNSLEVSRDGSTLTVAYGSTVSFWDAYSLVNLRDIEIPTKVNSASLHPDKNIFVCGGEDLKMYKFDYTTGNEIESFRGHFGPVHCVRFSPDGELYASGSEDGTLRLWQTTVGKTYGLWKCVDAADPVIIAKTEVTTN